MNVRWLGLENERSLFSPFLFLLVLRQGPIRKYFICRLTPGFQMTTSFYSFVQIQRNQRPRLRYDPLYPVKQLKHVFESFKICFQTDLNLNLLLIIT